MDVGAMDELDDIEPKMMKFVRGRLSASDLRFVFKTGTQRVHGRGMNKAWKDGSQGVFVLTCPDCKRRHCPEEEFPQIIRMRNAECGMVLADGCEPHGPVLGECRAPKGTSQPNSQSAALCETPLRRS